MKTILLPNFSIFAFAVKIPGDPDATNATLMLKVNGLYSNHRESVFQKSKFKAIANATR